jgi:integrase
MGHSRERVGVNGLPRYIAYYDDARGRRRSAGTYATRKQADRAWQRAEAEQLTGRPGDPRAGRIRFADYVNVHWFPHHVLEHSTRESYRYNLGRHILPWFGSMRMGDILPIHVREWVTDLIGQGVTPATIRHQKIILSAIFTTALNDFVISLHPCRGVKTPAVPVKEYQILSPEEITRLLAALPGDTARLLVEVAIESGLRWGELIELRPADLNTGTGVLTVSRAVVELHPDDHPDGGRFLVKPYPKSRRTRRFRLDPALIRALKQHIKTRGLDDEDLLFHLSVFTTDTKPGAARPVLVDAEQLGHTEPNVDGRTYRQGTLSAYTAGACRCPHCRAAFASYRARRRENGHDSPRGPRPVVDSDGHLPRNWWRTQIWTPACAVAELHPRPRMHDLRHSHASWLLAGGADLQTVKDRLGHQSITTTEKYLHTLPDTDDTALTALRRIRNPHA